MADATAPAEAPDVLPAPKTLKGREDRPQRPTPEVLKALEADKAISRPEASSALEWFLAEDPEESEEETATHTIEINVGVGVERWISWVVRPIDDDELRRIQRQSAVMRRRSRQDDVAIDQLGNARVIVQGSVDPDIEQIAAQQNKDPVAVVMKRFKKKPGLIAQLAGQIMALSGFDDEDVRDAISAKN